MWADICQHISESTGIPFQHKQTQGVGGGCINSASVLQDGQRRFFVKTNRAETIDMFEAEAEGLHEMRTAGAIRVPEPICHGVAGGESYLVLEHIEMGGRGDAREMGKQLAAMHRKTRSTFGWHRNNTIGSTPQINTEETDWVTFYREHRLRYQLKLAARKGQHFSGADRLLDSLERFFENYQPEPALLHGDLWGGNASFDEAGKPVLFDPATYYGDREADIAFTEMFGGFGHGFYAAYQDSFPLDSGYKTRKDLYNLYHLLNHYNLFGGSYASSAQSTIDRLLRAQAGL